MGVGYNKYRVEKCELFSFRSWFIDKYKKFTGAKRCGLCLKGKFHLNFCF